MTTRHYCFFLKTTNLHELGFYNLFQTVENLCIIYNSQNLPVCKNRNGFQSALVMIPVPAVVQNAITISCVLLPYGICRYRSIYIC